MSALKVSLTNKYLYILKQLTSISSRHKASISYDDNIQFVHFIPKINTDLLHTNTNEPQRRNFL